MEKHVYGEEAWKQIQENFNHVKGLYLDHAGSTLYSKSLIENSLSELTKNCFGNPHSRNTPSKLTTDLVDQTRMEILNFFQADPAQYSLIFTSGATDSLRLVAESFQFSNNLSNYLNGSGIFVYLKESHTSVIGMREYFKSHVPCYALPSDEITTYFQSTNLNCIHQIAQKKCNSINSLSMPYEEQLIGNISSTQNPDKSEKPLLETANSLFVFPAQCNFSGFKYPLELISASQEGVLSNIKSDLCINKEVARKQGDRQSEEWFCLLDAASYVGTNPLDLSLWSPDFVALSFYKIFGYPTGLGALIVHRRCLNVLQKKYFGGGSVEVVTSSRDFHSARQLLQEKFENGTINFLAILSLRLGIRELIKIASSMKNISIHTFQLGQLLYQSMCKLKHANGRSLVDIYAYTDFSDRKRQGAIIAFNLMDDAGEFIGYAHVEKILAFHDIHVRTGCFCNPAACQRFLNLSDEDVESNHKSGHKCGDEIDVVCGRPTGAVRVSFGYMSQRSDVFRFIEVISQCFLRGYCNTMKMIPEPLLKHSTIQLTSIHVYPIKSCGGFSPKSWPISKCGLLYDRHWIIVNEAGAALTQKREPKLCMIRPDIDLKEKKLTLRYHNSQCMISMNINDHDLPSESTSGFTKICGKMTRITECDSSVNNWLSEVLDQPGVKLLRSYNSDSSLVNASSFLLLNRNSVVSLQQQFSNLDSALSSTEECLTRFRGNFVINGAEAFEEDTWMTVKLGSLIFQNAGPCYRCQMVCVDQNSATRHQEAMLVLAEFRGKKMPFGICLEMCSTSDDHILVEVGSSVLGCSDG